MAIQHKSIILRHKIKFVDTMPFCRFVLLVMLVFCLHLEVLGQSRLSVSFGTGGEYLLPDQPLQQRDLWRNANAGTPLSFSLEYEYHRWWAALALTGGRQRWEAGPGNPVWPGRNKPIHHAYGWWTGAVTAQFGHRIPFGFLNQLQLTPFVGLGYDWHEYIHYCGAGATVYPDPSLPVSQATVSTSWQSGLIAGSGVLLDYRLSSDAQPVWLRIGVSGWWRQAPLLKGFYHLWRNGGQMSQLPPWGSNPPRPGQRISMEECPESFSVSPDDSYEIDLPGHRLNWIIGLRLDL